MHTLKVVFLQLCYVVDVVKTYRVFRRASVHCMRRREPVPTQTRVLAFAHLPMPGDVNTLMSRRCRLQSEDIQNKH